MATRSAKTRIEARTVRTSSGCLVWTGSLNRDGYASTRDDAGSYQLIHRLYYRLMVGPIPEGFALDHLCRNRACCEPARLEPVTWRQNSLRGHTIAARNAAKTHCDKGHPYDEANTYIRVDGAGRGCRACNLAAAKRYKNRRAAA